RAAKRRSIDHSLPGTHSPEGLSPKRLAASKAKGNSRTKEFIRAIRYFGLSVLEHVSVRSGRPYPRQVSKDHRRRSRPDSGSGARAEEGAKETRQRPDPPEAHGERHHPIRHEGQLHHPGR